MEGVYAVEFRHAHHIVQMLVVHRGKSTVAFGVGLQYVGACITAGPSTVVHDIIFIEAVDSIVHDAVGHLTAEAGDDGLHTEFTHALKHISAELLLTGVPPVGVTVHLHTCA